jgi:hypothetical protein
VPVRRHYDAGYDVSPRPAPILPYDAFFKRYAQKARSPFAVVTFSSSSVFV